MVENGYTEYDTIKVKLRIDDDSMRDEIQLYMNEIDDLIDNRLRAKLGRKNVYGSEIILPLTFETIPEVTLELKAIANDMVVAKIRLQNSEKPMLWDSAVNILENYLYKVYGWTRDKPFEPERTLIVTPVTGLVNSTITISGKKWEPNQTLEIHFDGTEIETTPTAVNTDSDGTFTDSTFDVPTETEIGQREIKVVDNFGGIETTFLVIE